MKKIALLIITIVMCVGLFSACGFFTLNNINDKANVDHKQYNGYRYAALSFIMNEGETFVVTDDLFSDWGIEYYKYEIYVPYVKTSNYTWRISDAFIIENNIIRATNSGFATLQIRFYRNERNEQGKKVTIVESVPFANIHVINESTMIPITTAQDLANIKNNLWGHYILLLHQINLAKRVEM